MPPWGIQIAAHEFALMDTIPLGLNTDSQRRFTLANRFRFGILPTCHNPFPPFTFIWSSPPKTAVRCCATNPRATRSIRISAASPNNSIARPSSSAAWKTTSICSLDSDAPSRRRNLPDQVWPLCLEAQLAAGSAGEVRVNGGSLVHELTTGNPKSVPRRTPGTEKPVGEWNAYDIVCRSNTVAIHVNGTLQNEITGSSVDAGAIGLQAGGKPVEFRNLVLEPLAEAAKP
jgi:Domain of Unknown Function (DUF1080)